MIVAALISTLAFAIPAAPLGVKTAKSVTSFAWALLPAKDARGQAQRLAIELRVRKTQPEPFPIHLRIHRSGLHANTSRLMLLRQVDAKGQIEVRTACQWDVVNQTVAELTWFVPSGPPGIRRFVLDFAPAVTTVVIEMRPSSGKLVYEAHKKATYTVNPVGARIEKLEIDGLKPPTVSSGKGLDVVPGAEAKTFKLIQELNGPLCYRTAALADGKVVKRLTLYAGIHWHETEIHGDPARMVDHTISFPRPVIAPRSASAYAKDDLLLGIASLNGKSTITSTASAFAASAPGPVGRFLTFAGIERRTVATPVLERLVASAAAVDEADAEICIVGR